MSETDILVVEDDPAIRRGLVDALTYAGHRVRETDDGDAVAALVEQRLPDLVLLDVMLPGKDGFELLAHLRGRHPGLPVIMVTARGAEHDRVRGLEGGADDYVLKPFSARELLARVSAVLRRSPERPREQGSLFMQGREVDLIKRQVEQPDGSQRDLSEKEAQLLEHLARAGGRPVTRDELLTSIWGLDPKGLQTRTVDMHVARLREKLGDDGADPHLVVTVRGLGYRLGDDVEVRAP